MITAYQSKSTSEISAGTFNFHSDHSILQINRWPYHER